MVNKDEAWMFFSKVIKTGHIYDPNIRKEALIQLETIMSDPKIDTDMLDITMEDVKHQLGRFNDSIAKNIVLLVDTHKDTENINKDKAKYLLEVFDNLSEMDKLSLITTSRKVNVVYSLSK